ncbi:hypothetical protein [Allorhodopirellula solitaria]|uniref:hypothetical protein n=1 Tax=Allorhodopirellula solitaria TaxID=2527987 RepID=UPI0011B526CA|nr:hypothetical protein [Allorhodopirellula solitaria]
MTSASNQASAGGWVIRDAGPNYGISANLPAVIDEMTHSVFSVPGKIATLPLDMLINSEGLTLVRSTKKNGMTNRPEALLVEFDYTPTAEDLKQWSAEGFGQATPPAMSGTMTLVPNWHYALANYSVTARPNVIGRGKSSPVRISASIDYRSRNIATIPSRVEQTISSDGMTREVKCDIAEVAFDGVDDSEFTLTHYGLPEVAVEPVRLSTGWKLILLSNAILAIGLLVLLYHRFYAKSKGGHSTN